MFLWDPEMTIRSYKNLNLVRANIETESRQFIENKNYSIQSIGPMPWSRAGLRVVFTRPGVNLATVDIFYNGDGSTTIQYLTGANRSLGQELADHLLKPSILLNLSR